MLLPVLVSWIQTKAQLVRDSRREGGDNQETKGAVWKHLELSLDERDLRLAALAVHFELGEDEGRLARGRHGGDLCGAGEDDWGGQACVRLSFFGGPRHRW